MRIALIRAEVYDMRRHVPMRTRRGDGDVDVAIDDKLFPARGTAVMATEHCNQSVLP